MKFTEWSKQINECFSKFANEFQVQYHENIELKLNSCAHSKRAQLFALSSGVLRPQATDVVFLWEV